MRNFIAKLGIISTMLGIATVESDNMLVPLGLLLVGGALLFIGVSAEATK